jgi:chemotaxis protein methyltransferase WspC
VTSDLTVPLNYDPSDFLNHDLHNKLTRPMNATDPCFEAWLSQETGIDASSLGINALERAVLERVRATQSAASAESVTGLADGAVHAYWQLLNSSPDERLALVEVLVVPETWFFRDREAFVALARLANEKLVRDPSRVVRVLSVPCSSGEEPYSVAMALLDAGIAAERFTIDALDISARAIELAQQGVYGRNSFRGGEYAFRDRHFSRTDAGWVLNERIQQTVRFAQANLFEPSPTGGARYDFIFCRNVLIYFHRDAQDRAIHLLDARLADDGTIFVGPAETGLMMRHTLSSARIPLAFAFQRTPPEEAAQWRFTLFGKAANAGVAAGYAAVAAPHGLAGAPGTDGMSKTPALPFTQAASAFVPASAPASAPAFSPPALKPPPAAPRKAKPASALGHATPALSATPGVSLAEARQLADAGQFDKAERVAHEFVIVHGPHAEAFYLLGLIADAQGHAADASDYYRKALYLEPAHYEALTHLAALLDVTGDSAGAQQLMRRAQRAAAKAAPPGDAPLNSPRGAHGSRRH